MGGTISSKALNCTIHGLMALQLHVVLRAAIVDNFRSRNRLGDFLEDLAREIASPFACENKGGRLYPAHHFPTLPLHKAVKRHALHQMNFRNPA